MPWCEECAKYWAPSTMTPEARCPTCGWDPRAPVRRTTTTRPPTRQCPVALQVDGGGARRLPRLALLRDVLTHLIPVQAAWIRCRRIAAAWELAPRALVLRSRDFGPDLRRYRKSVTGPSVGSGEPNAKVPPSLSKRTIVSLLQYEAGQSSALIPYDPSGQYTQPTRRESPGLAILAMVVVPAVFWASVAWLIWGSLGAAIAGIVVLVVSSLTLGLVRSARRIDTPVPTRRRSDWRQAA